MRRSAADRPWALPRRPVAFGVEFARADVVLACLALIAGALELHWAEHLPPGGAPLQSLYLAGVALAVLLRTPLPEWSAGTFLVATVVVCTLSQPYQLLTVGISFTVLPFLYAAYASSLDGVRLWAVLGVLVAAVAVRSLDDPQQGWSEAVIDQVFLLAATSAGLLVRRYRNRARHLGQAVGERAREAVEAERARIARELHDVVGHQVTAMIVTADAERGALDAVLSALAAGSDAREREAIASARDSLAAIEATGRQCLTEMRHLVGLLKTDGTSSTPTGSGSQPSAPSAGLEQLPELIRSAQAAGLRVTLDVDGEPQPLESGVGRTAYRVVQESLTNVLRHCGRARVVVRLGWTADTLTVQVQDDGFPLEPPGAPTASAGKSSGRAPGVSSGNGLAGLRERTRIYGGAFHAGPADPPAHGWTVRATLPLQTLDGDTATLRPDPTVRT